MYPAAEYLLSFRCVALFNVLFAIELFGKSINDKRHNKYM